MATNVIPQSIEQSKLVVLPAPQAVTQLELGAYCSLRVRLHQLQQQVEQAEESIKTRLQAGAILEPGDHRAELKDNFRRNVAWKAVVMRLAERLRMNGETYCAKVLNSTKPTRTVSLIVE